MKFPKTLKARVWSGGVLDTVDFFIHYGCTGGAPQS